MTVTAVAPEEYVARTLYDLQTGNGNSLEPETSNRGDLNGAFETLSEDGVDMDGVADMYGNLARAATLALENGEDPEDAAYMLTQFYSNLEDGDFPTAAGVVSTEVKDRYDELIEGDLE